MTLYYKAINNMSCYTNYLYGNLCKHRDDFYTSHLQKVVYFF